MVLKYKLKENDFFQMSLFFFKEQKTLRKVTIKNIAIWFTIYLIIILTLFFNNQKFGAIIISIGATIGLAINPFRIKVTYFNRLKNDAKLYENRVNKIINLEIIDEYVKVTGNENETKINLSQIEKVIETKQHFFLKFNLEVIIIPKSEIENEDLVKTKLIKLAEKQKITYDNQLNWKW
jgi:hypothetical protein